MAIAAVVLIAVASGCGGSTSAPERLSSEGREFRAEGWKTDFARHEVPLSEFTDPYAYSSSGEQDSNVPYSWYVTKVPVYHPRTVRGVDDASRVYGVVLGGRAKAYPVPDLRGEKVVEDVVAGQPLVVVPNEAALSATIYSRRVGDRVLSFTRGGGALVDTETATRWSASTGHAISGPLAGRALGRLPAVTAYWFAWRRFFPETEIWRPARRDE